MFYTSSFVDLRILKQILGEWVVFEALNHSGNVRTIACRGPSRSTQDEAAEVGFDILPRWSAEQLCGQLGCCGPARTVGNLRRRQRKVQRPEKWWYIYIYINISQEFNFTGPLVFKNKHFVKQTQACRMMAWLVYSSSVFFVALWPFWLLKSLALRVLFLCLRLKTLPPFTTHFLLVLELLQIKTWVFEFLQKPRQQLQKTKKGRTWIILKHLIRLKLILSNRTLAVLKNALPIGQGMIV